MRTSFFALVFVFSLVLVAGCSLGNTDERADEIRWVDFSEFSQDTTALAGAWEWKYTLCCYGDFGVSTPSSTGQTSTLIFTEDDTVEVYWNDELERQTTLEDYLDRAQWGVKGDMFAISTAYLDGPESVYERAE